MQIALNIMQIPYSVYLEKKLAGLYSVRSGDH